MVLSGLCYLLLAITGALGLGFGALLTALHASWPAQPWAAAAAAGLYFVGAAAGALLAGRWGSAGPAAWTAGGGLVLGTSALLALGVSGPGDLLLLRLVGGAGAGAIEVIARERVLGAVSREAGAVALGGAAAAAQAGVALAFWGGPGLLAAAGWQGAVALPGGLLLACLPLTVLLRGGRPPASSGAPADPPALRRLLPMLPSALLANGAFGAGLLLLPLSLEEQGAFSPQAAGALAAGAALATILAGPLVGLLGGVVGRRRRVYSAAALLVAGVASAFALRPAGTGWEVGLLAVAWGAAGSGLAALFPTAVAVGGSEARVTVTALCHLGTGTFLLGLVWPGAGPGLWGILAAAAAVGGLMALASRE